MWDSFLSIVYFLSTVLLIVLGVYNKTRPMRKSTLEQEVFDVRRSLEFKKKAHQAKIELTPESEAKLDPRTGPIQEYIDWLDVELAKYDPKPTPKPAAARKRTWNDGKVQVEDTLREISLIAKPMREIQEAEQAVIFSKAVLAMIHGRPAVIPNDVQIDVEDQHVDGRVYRRIFIATFPNGKQYYRAVTLDRNFRAL